MPTHILPIRVEKAPLYCADDRILLGEGLFETVRVDEGRPCYSYLHWQRMHQAAMTLGIPFDLSSKKWHEQLLRCIQVAKIQGLLEHGHTSSLLLEAFRYPLHQQALCLVSAPWLRDARNPIYRLKSVNYLESILARRYALEHGADDALFYNLEHYVTETTIANLFIIKQNQIYTPLLSNGVLAGIIRARILCLCRDLMINCSEINIDKTTVHEVDAMFVTNALQGIRVVRSVDGRHVPVGNPLVTLLQQILATDKLRWD